MIRRSETFRVATLARQGQGKGQVTDQVTVIEHETETETRTETKETETGKGFRKWHISRTTEQEMDRNSDRDKDSDKGVARDNTLNIGSLSTRKKGFE
jgi:hypothetical protein